MRRHPRLPTARLVSDEPTEAQVRWVMRATWLMLALGTVLALIGNYVPLG
jgi:hypothetical protein